MKAAKYIGDAVFRMGDKPVVKGQVIEGQPALIDALCARPDFELVLNSGEDIHDSDTEPVEIDEEQTPEVF